MEEGQHLKGSSRLESISFLSLLSDLLTVILCLDTVQFEGAQRESSRGQTEQSRLTKAAAASAEPATLRLCSDTPAVLGERVDPFLPLEKQV